MVPDWLSAFHTMLEDLNTPELYKRWVGVFTLGAALQRRVWSLSDSRPVYPNLYVFLCGPSATGKSVALMQSRALLANLDQHFLAPSAMTGAHLGDELKASVVSMFTPSGEGIQFNPLTIMSSELGVLLPVYDTSMMSRLTDIYDGDGFSEGTRAHGRLEIPDAHLSLIAGCTPARLQNMLPEGAWNEGFMARVTLVYAANDKPRQIVEERESANDHLTRTVTEGLLQRVNRYGRIRWSKEGLAALNHWLRQGMKPLPSHPKLQFYSGRRHYTILKLALIFCVSRTGASLDEEDFLRAQDLLLETEAYMPDAFKAMRSGGDQSAIEELWHYVYKSYLRSNQPVPRSYLVRFLSERVPAHSIERIIDLMVAGEMLKLEMVNRVGATYIPLKPQED